MTYAELAALPPEAYLNADTFRTLTDGYPAPGYCQKQYDKALAMGRAGGTLHISIGSVWSFDHGKGSSTSSSEGIGYHACTYRLLQGFLDSGCGIVVHRYRQGKLNATTLR